jgi:hypothetical protein
MYVLPVVNSRGKGGIIMKALNTRNLLMNLMSKLSTPPCDNVPTSDLKYHTMQTEQKHSESTNGTCSI